MKDVFDYVCNNVTRMQAACYTSTLLGAEIHEGVRHYYIGSDQRFRQVNSFEQERFK